MSARASATRWAWPPETWVGLRFSKPGELDEGQHLADAALDLAVLDLLAAQAEGDVLVDREVREEGVVLEDGVDVPPVRRQPGHVLAVQLDQAGRRLLEAADHAQRRGLAAAGRPQEGEELAVAHLEVDVVDGGDVAELLHDIHEPDFDVVRHGRLAAPLGRGGSRRADAPGDGAAAPRRWRASSRVSTDSTAVQ